MSLLDAPGRPFHDPAAAEVLFETLEGEVRQNADRQVLRVPHNINDDRFVAALLRAFRDVRG